MLQYHPVVSDTSNLCNKDCHMILIFYIPVAQTSSAFLLGAISCAITSASRSRKFLSSFGFLCSLAIFRGATTAFSPSLSSSSSNDPGHPASKVMAVSVSCCCLLRRSRQAKTWNQRSSNRVRLHWKSLILSCTEEFQTEKLKFCIYGIAKKVLHLLLPRVFGGAAN